MTLNKTIDEELEGNSQEELKEETTKRVKKSFQDWDKIKPFIVIKIYNSINSNKDYLSKSLNLHTNEAIAKKLKSLIDMLLSTNNVYDIEEISSFLQDKDNDLLVIELLIDILEYSRDIVEKLTKVDDLELSTFISFLRNKIFIDESINWNYMKVLPEDQINYMIEEISKKMKVIENRKLEIDSKKTIAKYIDWNERIVSTKELLDSISQILNQFTPWMKQTSANESKDGKTLIIGLNQMMFWDEKKTQSFEWTREKCLLKLESVLSNLVKYQLNNKNSYESLRIYIWGHTIEDKLAKDNQSYKTKRYILRTLEMVFILRSAFHFLKPYFKKVNFIIMNNDTERSQRVSEFVQSNNYLPSSNYLIGKFLKQILEEIDKVWPSVYHGNYDARALDYILEDGRLQRITTSKYMKTTDIYAQASINSEVVNGKTNSMKMASVIKLLESFSSESYFYHSSGYTKVTINSFSWVYGETEFILSPQRIQNRRLKPSNDFVFLTEENWFITSHEVVWIEIQNSLKILNKFINITALDNKISQIANPINTAIKDLL